MSENRYVVRPRADRDLDDQAHYYATVGSAEVGHSFLVAAHEAFTLLATQPDMGWNPGLRNPGLKSLHSNSFSVMYICSAQHILR